MDASNTRGGPARPALRLLLLLALLRFAVHTLTNGQYGWHRDELAFLDDARHLAWGYVAYPPVTPALARAALELFGASLVGVRTVAVLAQCAVMVVSGLIAFELGGSRLVQVFTALAVAITGASFYMSATLMYVSVDFLWWVLVAYFVARRIRTDDPRWWLGVGAAVGLGLMTKYTMAFLAVGLAAGVLLTPLRRDLRSRWLWTGAGLALLLWAPNLLWQVQHDFISLEFLSSIHERDVAIGRTQGFLTGQLYLSTNPFTVPVWLAGLAWLLFLPAGKAFRALAWLYLAPLVLFIVVQARDYYLAPAYPALLAAGSVAWAQWLADRSRGVRLAAQAYAALGLAVWAVFAAVLVLPIAPIGSTGWEISAGAHDLFREEIGWPELAQQVADVYNGLPASERALTGILAGNYGEAGAVNLYGPALGLPTAISGINSYWERGYGDPAATTFIVLGYQHSDVGHLFKDCELTGPVTNPYSVVNEETEEYPGIFLCRGLVRPWSEVWPNMLHFG